MVYEVKVAGFEGPLDLLLHLIKEDEVNIYDIPIARITDQYFQYLTMMQELDLEVAGEFLVMAATLIYIKSRMLLPSPPVEEGEEEDPRAPLVNMLLEYQRFQEAALGLGMREEMQRQLFTRSVGLEAPDTERPLEIDLLELVRAFQEILSRAKTQPTLDIARRPVTVGERMVAILDAFQETDTLPFAQLFSGSTDRAVLIATFLALLELLRQGLMRVRQLSPFGEITLFRVKVA
ncbi:MAG: segregation and condensation protein A [Candidatus Methylomirabilales bacterium]